MAFIGALRRRRKIPNVKGGLLADNAYSATLTGLSPETQYWYKACLKVDNQTFYGEVKSLTTVWIPVGEVALDKSEYAFHTIGSTLTLIPTVSPSDASDKSVSWKSSDESVATVDQTGKVTAIGNGVATITVSWSICNHSVQRYAVEGTPRGGLAPDVLRNKGK